jgi:hypothetical protein
MGRWYTLEQYQKLLNPEVSTPKEVETPNVSEQSKTEVPSALFVPDIPVEENKELENPKVEVKEESPKPVKKSKKSNKK